LTSKLIIIMIIIIIIIIIIIMLVVIVTKDYSVYETSFLFKSFKSSQYIYIYEILLRARRVVTGTTKYPLKKELLLTKNTH
jgi:hypothetical protein